MGAKVVNSVVETADVLKGWPAACVDLVYLDPPFNSKANYNVLYGSRSRMLRGPGHAGT